MVAMDRTGAVGRLRTAANGTITSRIAADRTATDRTRAAMDRAVRAPRYWPSDDELCRRITGRLWQEGYRRQQDDRGWGLLEPKQLQLARVMT